MTDADDVTLVRRAQANDVDAFRRLFDRHHERLYNYVLYMVGDPDDAADLTQAAFINAWRNLRRLKAPEAFVSWLHRIASNLTKDHAKKRRDTPMADVQDVADRIVSLGDAPPNPEDVVTGREAQETVRRAVASLPEKHRDVVVMHHLEGMEVAEIAGALGVPEGTVLSRLARARDALRRKLTSLVDEPREA